MSYSQLVLSDRPAGYWEYPQISQKNYLTENQYSIETNTSGWSAVNGSTTISRITTDSWVGTASLLLTASSSTETAIRMSSGSRVQLAPGVTYTFVTRVKRGIGSRNAAVRIEYYTTNSGSTLSETVRSGQTFALSSSEWTTIYHTETIPSSATVEYYASLGVISTSGNSSDTIICDGFQLYSGYAYQLLDHVSTNDIDIPRLNYQSAKPIIFGTSGCLKLGKSSFAVIENNYKLFISGSESKPATIDFWFSIEKPPSYRHSLVKIGAFLDCYVERDRVYIECGGKKTSIQVVDWDSQHYIAICYYNKKVDIYLDDRSPESIILDENFRFNDLASLTILPQIVFGPSSDPRNLIFNPSFENDSTGWSATGTGCSISSVSTDSFSGTSCLEITKAASTNCGVVVSKRIPVDPYKKYYASAYIKIPTGSDSGTISIVIDEYADVSGGSILKSSSSSASISSSSGWILLNTSFSPDIYTQYISIKIIQPTAGTAGKKFLVDGILLENNNYLPEWDEESDNSDPLFISSIGLYAYEISRSQMNSRIKYATKDSSDDLAIRYSGDRLNTYYNSVYSTKELDISELSGTNDLILKNFISTDNGLMIDKVKPVQIRSGPSGGSYSITRLGVSFVDDCYAIIEDGVRYMNASSATIRMQTTLSTTSGDGILLSLSPIIGYYAFIIKKESNIIKGLLLNDFDDLSPTEVFTTTTLTNSDYNISLNIGDRVASFKVGSQEFLDLSFPTLASPVEFYLGNLPGLGQGYPDPVRNFAIDDLTSFSDIDWFDPGMYMLRFNGDLNVSQKAILNCVVTELAASNNSIITFNNASKSELLVNNQVINENTYIPDFVYDAPEAVEINALVITEDSFNDSPRLNNIYLSSYDSTAITSSLSNFQLVPNVDGSSNIIVEPYVVKSNSNNVLAHDSNIGIRFENSSSGCKVKKVSVNYECFEFIFKINKYSNSNDTYTIFDIAGASAVNLMYSDGSLVKTGTYDLYIDGLLVTDISTIDIVTGEIYSILVSLPASSSEDIHLGRDKSASNVLIGSIGNICLYENTPINTASYALSRYQDLIGRISFTISGGNLSVNDEPAILQTYYRDSNNNYYEMLDLPRAKFVVSSWEEIDLAN